MAIVFCNITYVIKVCNGGLQKNRQMEFVNPGFDGHEIWWRCAVLLETVKWYEAEFQFHVVGSNEAIEASSSDTYEMKIFVEKT